VDEIISSRWRPLLFPSGKHPEEAYRFFNEPTETLYTVASAYPHLDASAKEKVRRFVANLGGPGGALAAPTGRRVYDAGAGQVRSYYEHPPEKLMRADEGIVRGGLARLYPLWLWAQVSGDWGKLETDWPALRKLIEQPPNKFEEDCRNGHLAGLIAYCRIADHLKDTAARSHSLTVTRKAMRDRLVFELSHTRGGLIWSVPKLRSQFSRWHFLTPEVGRLLAEFAKPIHRQLMEAYVDYHRPTWWLAWSVETMMRNECPYQFFAARSLILGEPAERLAAHLDIPWCRGDEFYIQKLAHALEDTGDGRWMDRR
jgi:hypothetical protein